MASLPNAQFPLLWRGLGLSIAAAYGIAGTLAIVSPSMIKNTLGLKATNPESNQLVRDTAFLIALRNFSIAAAIGTFYYRQQPKNMAVVIVSSLILCIGDAMFVCSRRREMAGFALAVGVVSAWAGIAIGISRLPQL